MGQTVNLLAYAFGGSNPSPPTKEVSDSPPKLFFSLHITRIILKLAKEFFIILNYMKLSILGTGAMGTSLTQGLLESG